MGCIVLLGVITSPPQGSGANTLNRVVASIGHQAITERDLEQEYRFEYFLEGKPAGKPPDPATRQAVLNRLISQDLLAGQMSGGTGRLKDSKALAEESLQGIRGKFPSAQAYHSAIDAMGMTEAQVAQRLELYQRTLRMIDERLRPDAEPSPKEIQTYYRETFVPEYERNHTGPLPPIEEVSNQIERVLVQKNINALLGRWLEQLKSAHKVTIHSQRILETGK